MKSEHFMNEHEYSPRRGVDPRWQKFGVSAGRRTTWYNGADTRCCPEIS